ncbi:uncharacterized protein ISCGN_009006 [Ixodes scapularis]
MASSTVISELRSVFATFGIPRKVMSDNGTAFVSEEIKSFYSSNGIAAVTSAPYHPATNGQAERMVQQLKTALAKGGKGTLDSRPARAVRKHAQNLHPGHQLPPLEDGDCVRVRGPKSWDTKARVVGSGGPRSYRVYTERGREMRRNRRHLLKIQQKASSSDESGSDGYETADETLPPQMTPPGSGLGSTSSQHPETPPSPPPPRRSSRRVSPPHRLTYDENFEQEG